MAPGPQSSRRFCELTDPALIVVTTIFNCMLAPALSWFQTDRGSEVTNKHSKWLCRLLLLSYGLDKFALITFVWIASLTLYSKSCESSDTALAMLLGPFCDCKPSSLHDQRYQGSQQHIRDYFSQLLLQHLGNLQSPSL